MNNVCKTILEQLGGQFRLQAMTGAHGFVDLGDGIVFKMAGRNARGKGNIVEIKINGSDLYDVKVSTMRKYELTTRGESRDVYASNLRGSVERMTGRYLTL